MMSFASRTTALARARLSRFAPLLARGTLAAALCAALAVGLHHDLAYAQTDGETEVAKQRFKEGVRHYDQREYDKARLAFLQAYLLKPHPTVLLNLAQCELRAGRHADAAQNFAKYIRENPDADAMDHALAGLEEARQRVAEVNVEVTAPGASISVDGIEVGRSPLPHVLYLMPGRHTVAARKGGLSENRNLEAVAGQRVYVKLEIGDAAGLAGAQPLEGSPDAAEPQSSGFVASVDSRAHAPIDESRSKGFFGWLSDTPGAIATISVGGLALGTSAVLAAFANNRYAAAQDARDQIMAALEQNVNRGVLVGTATPCGENGVANREDSFDSRVAPEDVANLSGDFATACARFTERSDSGDRLKTLSLVSLGIGVAATVGTVVWYFTDVDGEPGAAGSHKSPARRRASLTPILSKETQGLWLNVTF